MSQQSFSENSRKNKLVGILMLVGLVIVYYGIHPAIKYVEEMKSSQFQAEVARHLVLVDKEVHQAEQKVGMYCMNFDRLDDVDLSKSKNCIKYTKQLEIAEAKKDEIEKNGIESLSAEDRAKVLSRSMVFTIFSWPFPAIFAVCGAAWVVLLLCCAYVIPAIRKKRGMAHA